MNLLPSHYQLALEAAIAASKEIMRIYENDFETIIKEDGSPLTVADLASSSIIQGFLEKTGIPVTGEETEKSDFVNRAEWSECWCVDPLDGTKEFISRNGEFAVNIALIRDGKPIFGIITAPVEQQFILGSKEIGVFIAHFDEVLVPSKWRKIEPTEKMNDPIVMVGSRSHKGGEMNQLLHKIEKISPNYESLCKGSSLKFFDLAEGRVDVYPRFAPTMEWDIASGQAILEALGGKVLDINTEEPLTYNKSNLLNPYFIAYTKAAFQKLCVN